jgi:hypothetical protein
MKNIEAAKELLEKYKSITLEQLMKEQKNHCYFGKGGIVLHRITGFGSGNCVLCKSVHSICKNCIYSFREVYEPHVPCIDVIYKEIEKAKSAEELYNAIQKRISYLTHVIEWYETMDNLV